MNGGKHYPIIEFLLPGMQDTLKTVMLVAFLLAVLGGASLLNRGTASLVDSQRREQEKHPRLMSNNIPPPKLSADAVMVERLLDKRVLSERQADLKLPIASLTKLMSALLLAEVGEPLASVTFSADAKGAGAADDKRSDVSVGDRLKAEDVLTLMLVASDNDAAYAAADSVAGRRPASESGQSFAERVAFFVRRMNERAGELHLANTHFANPTGRDDPENYSTARDLAALARFIQDTQPGLWAATRLQETFVFGESGRRYGVVNTNPILQEIPEIYGSKTGFDDQAKGALVMLYQLAPGDLIALVLLHSTDRFADGRALVEWVRENFSLPAN